MLATGDKSVAKKLIPFFDLNKSVFLNMDNDIYTSCIFDIVSKKYFQANNLLFCIYLIAQSNNLIPLESFNSKLKKKKIFKKVWQIESDLKKALEIAESYDLTKFLKQTSYHLTGTAIVFVDGSNSVLCSGVLIRSNKQRLFVALHDSVSYIKIVPLDKKCIEYNPFRIVPIIAKQITSNFTVV